MDSPTTASDQPIVEVLAEFVCELKHDDIPKTVRTRALHHMLDAAGIALASTRYEFAHKTLAGLQAVGGQGSVPVLGMPATLPLRDAAIMNGFLCHGLDYDDTHVAAIVHPTASVFPAVLSAAAHVGATGEELVTAFVAGVETAARVGMVAKSQFHQVGFHPTGMVGIFGCVLAVGKLMGLNKKQLMSAQGIAVSMASGSMEFLEDGAWNKRIHPGLAAGSAITAAAIAKEGFKGITDPYTGRFGLYNAYLGCGPRTNDIDLSLATAGLGETWELLATAIKPFPTCHFSHGAIDAALALRDDVGDPAEIKSIIARLPEGVHKTICEPEANKKRPQNDYDAKFSTHFLVAASLIRGRLTLDELEPDVLRDPDILALADKLGYENDPDSPFPDAYSGELIITMKDGRELRHREHINRGAADRPLSNEEIIAKFDDNAIMAVNTQTAAKQRAALLTLDSADVDAAATLSCFSPKKC
ncbi:MAG: MmgE/PrpD family protein [Hyphomicrobiaceae bacterium TMED74]|nr:2-methylcitrate dehydratase [Filomicrobium sp.]RPG45775.1 MAG: MmgE/PrpD family protein [Hyphomicrobiaceae bacterium TMED74]